MVFAQLTYREGLRDIEVCLGSRRRLLYHSGIRGRVKRCNLAYANEHRDARLFAEVAAVLMRRARLLYADEPTDFGSGWKGVRSRRKPDRIESGALSVGTLAGHAGAVKLNVMLAVTTEIPTFRTLVGGRGHDVSFLDDLPSSAGSYYVFDRGYLDLQAVAPNTRSETWFAIRAKCNTLFHVCESRPVDKATGLRCDQTIRFNAKQARRNFPEKLQRIRYYDAKTDLSLAFLTNNFALPELVIAVICRRRWEIELFFRWIKQHPRLRGFFSTCPNGVAEQVWTAIYAYLLVAIAQSGNGAARKPLQKTI